MSNANLQKLRLTSYTNLLRRMEKDSNEYYLRTGSHLAKGRACAFSLAIEAVSDIAEETYPDTLFALLVRAESELQEKPGCFIQRGIVNALRTAMSSLACLGLPSYPEVPAIADRQPAIQHDPLPQEKSIRHKVYIYNMEENIV